MGALDSESLCEQKVWSSELKMLSFLGIQTIICKKTLHFTQYNYDRNPKTWLLDESSNGNESPEAIWGESSHGNGYTEVT